MLRLTLLLCGAMIAALAILGQDRGQLRPGLAKAALEAERAPPAVAEAAPVATATPVVLAAPAVPGPLAVVAAPEPARPEPAPHFAPAREVVEVVEEPVFTLSDLGNEAVPGSDAPRATAEAPMAEAVAQALAEVPVAPGDPAAEAGRVWFVNASSVNVRAGPSTQAAILGRLGSGEAAVVLAEVGADWARILIEGDGMEGYVAIRYLSAAAP